MSAASDDLARRNRRVGLMVALGASAMLGLAFASVPLYELFCKVTGFGGTTQVVTTGPDRVLERTVRVRFDASMDSNLPWKFEPLQREVTVKLGEEKLVFYRATNLSQRPIVGTSTYNVLPDIAGQWFNKLQCFCFTEQLLMPGQSIDMPVVFFVDPDMAKERRYDGVSTITLSYTFFEARTDKARDLLSRLPPRDGAADMKRGG